MFIYNIMNLIFCCDTAGGIGKDNMLPWDFREDIQFFNKITTTTTLPETKNIVIMGRKTAESLPIDILPNRLNIIISKTKRDNKENKLYFQDFNAAVNYSKLQIKNANYEKIWIIGGSSIYNQAYNHIDLDKIYITKINKNFNCDTFIDIPRVKILKSNIVQALNLRDNSLHDLHFMECVREETAEIQYLKLMRDIYQNGEKRKTRNGNCISLFSKELKFDLIDGFPLLTTKKMFWRGIVEELLFFIRGDTNTKKLEEKGIKIWKGNTSKEFLSNMKLDYEEGEMGPMYGYQWRHFNKPYKASEGGIDQLQNLIKEIRENPSSRRLLLTDFNPAQAHEGVLYPCHSLILQFYVENNFLSVKMYQRSADVFLGLPFNIASTSLLLHIIAMITNLQPKDVTITLGDCHLYEEHLLQVETQLNRNFYDQPKLSIPKFNDISDVEKSTYENYILTDYNFHPGIKAQMIA